MKSKLICLLLLVACKMSFAGSARDSLLDKLNLTIENAHVYDAEKLKQINTLRQAFTASRHLPLQQQFNICQQLYEQFKVFKYDSAFAYARKLQELAREMNDSQRINYAGVKLGFVLLSSGMFRDLGPAGALPRDFQVLSHPARFSSQRLHHKQRRLGGGVHAHQPA